MQAVVFSVLLFFVCCWATWYSGQYMLALFYMVCAAVMPGRASGVLSIAFLAVYSAVFRVPVLDSVAYCLVGVVVQVACDRYKDASELITKKLAYMEVKVSELEESNRLNCELKDEYARRLLLSEQSLPNVYAMIKKVLSVSKDRLFMEVVDVVSGFVGTDTVAVYYVDGSAKYMRLICAKNDKSKIRGGVEF